jgi:hypothetical protein
MYNFARLLRFREPTKRHHHCAGKWKTHAIRAIISVASPENVSGTSFALLGNLVDSVPGGEVP